MATSIYSRAFWKSTGERAFKTLLQTSAGVIPTIFVADAAGVVSFVGVPSALICSVVLIPTVLSVITSLLAGLNGTGPSFVNSEIKTDAVILDEVELTAVETQEVLDQMVVDDNVPDVEPDSDAEPGDDAEPEGEADDEDPLPVVSAEPDESDAEPEGLADDEEGEVDLTPPPEGYVPRH